MRLLLTIGTVLMVGVLMQAEIPHASAMAGCKVSDIALDKLKAAVDSRIGYTRVTGLITNNCAESTGVQLKITLYDKADNIITTKDVWPASTKNIPGRSDWPFEWSNATSEYARFTVKVIDVMVWD